ATTRSLASEIPVTIANVTLATWGIWVADHMVKSPWLIPGWTSTPRGSMALGIRLGCQYRSCTTTGAFANVPSTSPTPPWDQVKLLLVPRSSWTSGAPSAIAASTSVTAGSGSYSTWTASAASTASCRLVATTTATASPM